MTENNGKDNSSKIKEVEVEVIKNNKSENSGLMPVPVPDGVVYDFANDIPNSQHNELVQMAEAIIKVIDDQGDLREITTQIRGIGRDEMRNFDTSIKTLERPLEDAMTRIENKGGEGERDMHQLMEFLTDHEPKKMISGPWWWRFTLGLLMKFPDSWAFGRIKTKNRSIKDTISVILGKLQAHLDRQDKNLIEIQQLFTDVLGYQQNLLCAGFVMWIVDKHLTHKLKDVSLGTTQKAMLANVSAGAKRHALNLVTAVRLNEQHISTILNTAEGMSLRITNLDRTITLVAPQFAIQLATQVFQKDMALAQASEAAVLGYIGDAMVESAKVNHEQAILELARANNPAVSIEKMQNAHEMTMKTIALYEEATEVTIRVAGEQASILSTQAKEMRAKSLERVQGDPFSEHRHDSQDQDSSEKK